MNPHIQKAIDYCGNASKLAKAAGVTPQAVLFWLRGDRQITAENALQVEQATNGHVTSQQLRPDVFGVVRSPGRRKGDGISGRRNVGASK